MNKYSIGYRLRFDDIISKDIGDFIKNYLELFDRFEIKLTEDLVSFGKLEYILKISEKLAREKYSMHIYKDVFYNNDAYGKMLKLIEVLTRYKPSEKVYLITHIPFQTGLEYLSKVFEIVNVLPDKYVLLLENVELESNNLDYLKQIYNMCKVLEEKNIQNVGLCLDIGHLLYGCSKENISESEVLNMLQEYKILLSKVMQIHIHDYLDTDHLQLNTGIMNLKIVSEFIVKNKLNVPIIIESTVKLPEDDGIRQVRIMEELLSES